MKSDIIFYNKKIAITGTLNHFNRLKAYNYILKLGGIPVNHVNALTDFLIVADEAIPSHFSSKKKEAAILLQTKGAKLVTISEKAFYKLINEN